MNVSKATATRRKAEADEITDRALKLLESDHLFAEFFDVIHRSGLVGEERNAAVLMLAEVSRLLDRPLNVIVKGHSSAGKNIVVTRTLRLLPRDAIRELTSSSAAAWNYSKDDFRHRIVYLQERNEASGAIHPVRLLISEGRLIRRVTVQEGRGRKSKDFVARGPIAAISTTTKNQLEIDDETRHISLWVDETRAQTRRIVMAYAMDRVPVSRTEVKIWRRAHELIEAKASSRVGLPGWFQEIAAKVFDGDVRVRRYFPAFVTACKAVTLLRSFQHDKKHEK